MEGVVHGDLVADDFTLTLRAAIAADANGAAVIRRTAGKWMIDLEMDIIQKITVGLGLILRGNTLQIPY